MNQNLRDAARELYYWQMGGATNFTAMLFELISKADRKNRSKIARGFPIEVQVFEEWYHTPTPGQFYLRYKIISKEELSV